MSSQWHSLDKAHPDHASVSASYSTARIGIISISGNDAAQFLQNLLTNDVMQLADGQCQLNGFCNPKGRLLATFLLLRQQERFLLLLPEDQVAFIAQRLGMFKLRSQVVIEELSENFGVVYLQDTSITSLNSIKLPWQESSSIVLCEVEKLPALLTTLEAEGMQAATPDQFFLHLLQSGVPILNAAAREQFTPQQINFEVIGGVSFRKGCYPGQEVVARLHYLGKPSRRMYLCQCQPVANVSAGAEVMNADNEVLGHIVQHADLDERCLLLVSFKLSARDQAAMLANGTEISDIWALVKDDE